MTDEKIQRLSAAGRLDYLAELKSEEPGGGYGHFVISAELKTKKQSITAEILVTGLVSEDGHESPIQYHLLPLLSLTLPLVAKTQLPERFSELGESFSGLERQAVEQLESLGDHLAKLALASRKAGGLKLAMIDVSDVGSGKKKSIEDDLRKMRQDKKFQVALAHAQAHFDLRNIPLSDDFIELGGQERLTYSELRFANLYTLARAIGVKEITPRISLNEGNNLTWNMLQKISYKSEPTVLVARLKRAGVIPE